MTVTNEEVQHATVARARGLKRGVFAAGSWSSWRRGTNKLVNAVGLSMKTQRQASISSMSASGDNKGRSLASSRQASGSSQGHGARPVSPNPGLSREHTRRWSIKRRAAASASVPTTPLMTEKALERTLTGSSSVSNPVSPEVNMRRLSGQSVPPAASVPIPMALRRSNSHMDGHDQASFPPGFSTSHSDADSTTKLSLRHMWDKLINVGRSQANSPSRVSRPSTPELRGRQRSQDTDASADSRSFAESDSRSAFEKEEHDESQMLPARSDFDSLGRKQRFERDAEEFSSEEDLSDSGSDSSLGEPIEGNFTYNNGYGWSGPPSSSDHHYGAGSTSQLEPCAETPRFLAQPVPGLPGTRDGSPSGMVASDAVVSDARRSSVTSSQAANTSSDLDVEEEEAALELNFGRRRRQTNAGDAPLGSASSQT